MSAGSLLDDPETYKNCEPLMLTAADGTIFRLPSTAASDVASGKTEARSIIQPTISTPPLTVAQISNQATLAARRAITAYYSAPAQSDDEVAPHSSRDICLRVTGATPLGSSPVDPESGSSMVRTITEASLYTQLSAFFRGVSIESAQRACEDKAEALQSLSPILRYLQAAAEAIEKLRSRSLYRWVNLGDMFGASSDGASTISVR